MRAMYVAICVRVVVATAPDGGVGVCDDDDDASFGGGDVYASAVGRVRSRTDTSRSLDLWDRVRHKSYGSVAAKVKIVD